MQAFPLLPSSPALQAEMTRLKPYSGAASLAPSYSRHAFPAERSAQLPARMPPTVDRSPGDPRSKESSFTIYGSFGRGHDNMSASAFDPILPLASRLHNSPPCFSCRALFNPPLHRTRPIDPEPYRPLPNPTTQTAHAPSAFSCTSDAPCESHAHLKPLAL